jgi:glutamyl endopeptidase
MGTHTTAEQPGPEIVFPSDNRVQINNTTILPYFWVGRVDIQFPSGAAGFGTGTLIGPDRVLTCAHNLYQKQYGGWASEVNFSLARNGAVYPYGSADKSGLYVTEDYQTLSPPAPNAAGNVTDYTRYLFDYGVIRLQKYLDPADGVFPGMYPATDNEIKNRLCDIAGYPGDKPPGTMWNGNGTLPNHADDVFLFYQISTYGGQSGSAVRSHFPTLPAPGVPRIIGIHVAGSTVLNSNFAVRLTGEVLDMLGHWL